jgi:hypothetical protein
VYLCAAGTAGNAESAVVAEEKVALPQLKEQFQKLRLESDTQLHCGLGGGIGI